MVYYFYIVICPSNKREKTKRPINYSKVCINPALQKDLKLTMRHTLRAHSQGSDSPQGIHCIKSALKNLLQSVQILPPIYHEKKICVKIRHQLVRIFVYVFLIPASDPTHVSITFRGCLRLENRCLFTFIFFQKQCPSVSGIAAQLHFGQGRTAI